jgi:hypothetical protein
MRLGRRTITRKATKAPVLYQAVSAAFSSALSSRSQQSSPAKQDYLRGASCTYRPEALFEERQCLESSFKNHYQGFIIYLAQRLSSCLSRLKPAASLHDILLINPSLLFRHKGKLSL